MDMIDRVGESVNIEDVDNVPKSAFIKVKKNKASSFAQDQENGLLLQHNDNSVEQIDLDPMQSNEGKSNVPFLFLHCYSQFICYSLRSDVS